VGVASLAVIEVGGKQWQRIRVTVINNGEGCRRKENVGESSEIFYYRVEPPPT